jgi:DNA-binding GntR family transcriptional regulator
MMVLQRESMSDRIKQYLLERIVDGTYQPGERLIELQIAKELNTSQAPVREALRELEAMRLVECEAYRGTRVREISTRELRESYQVRGELEAFAARISAPNFQLDATRLLEVHQDFIAAVEDKAKDFSKFSRINSEFHRLIVETANNTVLLRVWDSLGFETNLRAVKPQLFDSTKVVQEHQHIIDALVAGDGEKAGELLRQHALNALS